MRDDLALIRQAALDAGQLAMDLRKEGLKTWSKEGGSPVTNADIAVDTLLKERLMAARPDYGWLSEETADDPARLSKQRLFVVDPIDGTAAYMKDKPWFSVAIAVVEAGRPIAGVVHAPALDETYDALSGGGAWLNGAVIRPSSTPELHDSAMLGDEKMFAHPAWKTPWPPMRFATRNSIAYRMALVASGAYDLTISLGRTHEWDIAAGALLLSESGAHVSDHMGQPLTFNRPIPSLPSMLACAPGLAGDVLKRTASIKLPG
jgi:myo-inositol-1(or 4)-monophosphatase